MPFFFSEADAGHTHAPQRKVPAARRLSLMHIQHQLRGPYCPLLAIGSSNGSGMRAATRTNMKWRMGTWIRPQAMLSRILPSSLQTFPILISVKDPPKHIVSDHHSIDYIQLVGQPLQRVCVQHNCPAETHDHFPHIASSAKLAAHSAAHAGGGTWYGAARRELGPK